MNLRDGVLIQKNAIGPADLEFLSDHVRRARMTDSLVSNFESETQTGEVEWIVNTRIRDTQEVQLTKAIDTQLLAIHAASVLAFIDPYYQVRVRDSEPLGVLHYGSGGQRTRSLLRSRRDRSIFELRRLALRKCQYE